MNLSINTQSDYTPKDFLAKVSNFLNLKLLSKPSTSQFNQTQSSLIKLDGQLKSSQTNKINRIQSPKSPSLKRIHFQSVTNIQSIMKLGQKQNGSLQSIQQKKQYEQKQSPKKCPSIKNQAQNKLIRSKESNPQVSSQTSILQKKQVQQQLHTKNQNLNKEDDLMLKKTELLLKAVLNGTISNEQLDNVLISLRRGLQNPFQFDKILKSMSQKAITRQSKKEVELENHKKISRSIESKKLAHATNTQGFKRINSQHKYKAQTKVKSKKQLKRQIKQCKTSILKQIKKMKQIVFTNQKSIRLNKKRSLI